MKITLLFILFSITLSAQSISNTRLDTIVKLIISDSPEISNYILPEEFEIADRFGISYYEVANKFFIANEFPKVDEKIKYDIKIKDLENNYSLLNITFPSIQLTRDYYLKDSFILSKPFYYSRNWKTKESDHFKFIISDETLFNDYSIDQLEMFIEKMFNELNFSEVQKNEIKQKKIYYFLCKDESEIQKVTGFATRGMYILAQDYVVTTYNTHYHELVHFLINYKLKALPLYTHPFLQEGLAVAFGGRGGLQAHTIIETAVFLVSSSFANYSELLSRKDFMSTDASISYPISGLYVDFLIKQIGIEGFMKLYKKYSASKDLSLIDAIDKIELRSEENWNLFVDSLADKNSIKVKDRADLKDLTLITKNENCEIYDGENEYFFRVKDTLLIGTSDKIPNYQSKLFAEHLPQRKYNSEKYLIIANRNEISVYNLYSNNLIGKYVASFSIPPKAINENDGFYEFVIKKDLFDEKLLTIDFKS